MRNEHQPTIQVLIPPDKQQHTQFGTPAGADRTMNIDENLLDELHDLPGAESPQEDVDTLMEFQNKKVELSRHRDELAQKRLDLKEAIDRMTATLAHYKEQQRQYETKQKLDFYLHQNDHEYLKLSAPDDAATFVLENLDVLPSRDWRLRMELVGKFYPYMSISDTENSTVFEDNTLANVYEFVLSAEGLPSLKVKLVSRNETVVRLEIIDFARAEAILLKISPSYTRTLRTNYVRLSKVDLLFYSYHCLAKLQKRRIACFLEILHSWPAQVSRPASSWEQDPVSSLLSLPYIELTFEKDGKTSKVRLTWDIVVSYSATGHLESELSFGIINGDGSFLENSKDVFLALVPRHGVVKAFLFMLDYLFEMQS